MKRGIKNTRENKCLSLCRVGEKGRLYSIGPFFKSGLTVFKQQIRALNLIFAIHRQNDSVGKIAVIALNLGNASMFNTLLTYLLYQLKAFSYIYGEFELDEMSGHVRIRQAGVSNRSSRTNTGVQPIARTVPFTYDHLTIRHGADSNQTLLSVGLTKKQMGNLEKQQAKENETDTIEPLWPAGWWQKQIALPDLGAAEPIEFVPPATLTIASTFVSTLSNILIQLHRKTVPAEFRITVHRLLLLRGKTHFQQIAYYAGTRTEGSPGRVFDVETGLVGLVCRQGAPIVARKKTAEKWQKLWDDLTLTKHDAKPVAPKVNSIMGCPLFVPAENGGQKQVCLVLFIDSQQEDFFSAHIRETIFAASTGFVSSLDERVKGGDLKFATRSFRGYAPQSTPKDQKLFSRYSDTLELLDGGKFPRFIDKLTFKELLSFDAELQLPKLGRTRRNP